jgi:nitroreductase
MKAMKDFMKKCVHVLCWPYLFLQRSIMVRGVISYYREFIFYAGVVRRNQRCPNQEMLVRKYAHAVERYLLLPEAYSADQIKGITTSLESILIGTREGISYDLRQWAERILKEYQTGSGKVLCPMLAEGVKRTAPALEAGAVMKLMRARRSRRVFSGKPLTEDQREMITSVAQWTPSTCNRQCLRLIFVEDPQLKDFIAGTVPGGYQFFSKAPCILVFIADPGDYRFPDDRLNPFMEAGAAIQNVYLLCECLVLGCCWGSYTSFGSVQDEKEVRRLLRIPSNYLIVGALAIGHSEQTVCEIPRERAEVRYTINQFGTKA